MTTNTLILRLRDPKLFGATLGPQAFKEGLTAFILDVPLLCASEEPEMEIQCISFSMDLRPLLEVSITMFDIRNTRSLYAHFSASTVKTQLAIEEVNIDLHGGSNRSIIVPRPPSFSLDSLYSRFSTFGQIEKVWFTEESSLTIDFLDARAPMRVRSFIEKPQTGTTNSEQHESISFPTHEQLNGILTGLY